jgi:acyl-CoA reductase-like NAD-dependent aldehyde dehydrogenase
VTPPVQPGPGRSLPEPRLLIGGRPRIARGDTSFPVISPATEEIIGHAPETASADADEAIAAARRAFDESGWPRRSMADPAGREPA